MVHIDQVQTAVEDVRSLGSNTAIDVKTKQRTILEQVDFLDGGIPCESRASTSSKASQNINCLQSKTGTTGAACEKLLSC